MAATVIVGSASATAGSTTSTGRAGALGAAAARVGAAFSAWRQPSPKPRAVPASTPIRANTMAAVSTTCSPKISQPLVVASKSAKAFWTRRPAIVVPTASQKTPSRHTGRR